MIITRNVEEMKSFGRAPMRPLPKRNYSSRKKQKKEAMRKDEEEDMEEEEEGE